MKITTYRPPAGMRCVALDSDAKRCRRPALMGVQYHGSNELYGFLSGNPEPAWLIAYLCKKHSEGE